MGKNEKSVRFFQIIVLYFILYFGIWRTQDMVYTCKKCKFMFDRKGYVERCPDCGSENIRSATKQEQEEFEGYQKEFNTDNNQGQIA